MARMKDDKSGVSSKLQASQMKLPQNSMVYFGFFLNYFASQPYLGSYNEGEFVQKTTFSSKPSLTFDTVVVGANHPDPDYDNLLLLDDAGAIRRVEIQLKTSRSQTSLLLSQMKTKAQTQFLPKC